MFCGWIQDNNSFISQPADKPTIKSFTFCLDSWVEKSDSLILFSWRNRNHFHKMCMSSRVCVRAFKSNQDKPLIDGWKAIRTPNGRRGAGQLWKMKKVWQEWEINRQIISCEIKVPQELNNWKTILWSIARHSWDEKFLNDQIRKI